VNVGSTGIANTVVQRIKNETHRKVQIPQADRAKSARQQGAARTAKGVGEVTLPAAQAVGHALRENVRQGSPTVRAPARTDRQDKEGIHFTMRVQTSEIGRDMEGNNTTKMGIMQVDPYSMAKTPINITNFKMALEKYPSRQCAKEIEVGFSEGYKLGYIGPREFRECKNLKSAYDN
jgi:hypothetical protein